MYTYIFKYLSEKKPRLFNPQQQNYFWDRCRWRFLNLTTKDLYSMRGEVLWSIRHQIHLAESEVFLWRPDSSVSHGYLVYLGGQWGGANQGQQSTFVEVTVRVIELAGKFLTHNILFFPKEIINLSKYWQYFNPIMIITT